MKFPWADQPTRDQIACNYAFGHLIHNLRARLTLQGRIHAETYVAAGGAIAGFAAQRALFARIAETDDTVTRGKIQIVTAINGEKYLSGDPLVSMLLARSNSELNQKLWSLAGQAAVAAGLASPSVPNLSDLFNHVERTLGHELEGLPSLPKENHPHLPGKALLRLVWPLAMMCFTGRFPNASREFGVAPLHWRPIIAAGAAATFVPEVKDVLPPRKALVILMETAIYASRLDPRDIEAPLKS